MKMMVDIGLSWSRHRRGEGRHLGFPSDRPLSTISITETASPTLYFSLLVLVKFIEDHTTRYMKYLLKIRIISNN